jgi:cell division protease FtsH
MVCEWGMSKLGPLAFEKSGGEVFLGMQYGHQAHKEYSEAKAEEIDAEVSKIINTGYATAVKILTENKQALESITQALLEYETIDGHEVDMMINGAAVSEIEKYRNNRRDTNLALAAASGVGKKDDSSGSDPVGNTGPVTI